MSSLSSQPKFSSNSTLSPCRFESSLSDEDLVTGMLVKQASAWEEFHARYDRLLYRCITKVTGRFTGIVSPEDIREIYATLVLSLLSNDMHKLRSFDPERGNRLGTWLGMLAINAAYDHLRTVRREPNRGSLSEAESMWCEQTDPFGEVDRKQREQMVAEMLQSFSPKDRQFVTLYFEKGLEPEEVAARMQISIKTVYSKKHKIRTRLERLLCRERMAA